MISNAENNPHSVILNDVQKALSAALFFENMNNFTLGMHNYAPWPRTILLAGITNFQWEELETVAPTPAPHIQGTTVLTISVKLMCFIRARSQSKTSVPKSSRTHCPSTGRVSVGQLGLTMLKPPVGSHGPQTMPIKRRVGTYVPWFRPPFPRLHRRPVQRHPCWDGGCASWTSQRRLPKC